MDQEAGEAVSMLSLFHVPAMQFEFATTHVLFRGTIIMLTSCKSMLNLASLHAFAHVFEVYCSEMTHHLVFFQ